MRDMENAPHRPPKKDSLAKNANVLQRRKALASIDGNHQAPMMTRQVFGSPVNYVKVSSSSKPQPFVQLDIYNEVKGDPVREKQSSSTLTKDQLAVPSKNTNQCQGAAGCSKKVSQHCSFDCCGNCCKLGLGKAEGGTCQYTYHIRKEAKSSTIAIQKEEDSTKEVMSMPLSENETLANEASGCQGAPGCCKIPSKQCSFNCCGDCCRDQFLKAASSTKTKALCSFHLVKYTKASKRVHKCQGVLGCGNFVSNKCTFGLCGNCCKIKLEKVCDSVKKGQVTCHFHAVQKAKAVLKAAASIQAEEKEEGAARTPKAPSLPPVSDNAENRAFEATIGEEDEATEPEVATNPVVPTSIDQKEDKSKETPLTVSITAIPTHNNNNKIAEEVNDDESDCSEEKSEMMGYAYVYLPKTTVSPLTVVTTRNQKDADWDAMSSIMCDDDEDDKVSVITCDNDENTTTKLDGDGVSVIMCDEQNDDSTQKVNDKDESTIVPCEEVLSDEMSLALLPPAVRVKNQDIVTSDCISVIMTEEEVASPSLSTTKRPTKGTTTAAKSMVFKLRERAKKLSLARKFSSLSTVNA